MRSTWALDRVYVGCHAAQYKFPYFYSPYFCQVSCCHMRQFSADSGPDQVQASDASCFCSYSISQSLRYPTGTIEFLLHESHVSHTPIARGLKKFLHFVKPPTTHS